ncbi:MAG: zinc transporter ZntB [Rhodomicrobium sp.]|nr:MAG: zinc transporter ZntB [Rhodomicrobium sp.]
MSSEMPHGLVCGFDIDAGGQATELHGEDIFQPIPEGAWRWLHFDKNDDDAISWLVEKSGLRPAIRNVLIAPETRPRLKIVDEDEVLVLRGVNLNPHAHAEDMISIRLSVEKNRIISSRKIKLMAIDALRKAFAEGTGPQTIGDFIVDLAEGLTERVGPVVSELLEESDQLEEFGSSMDMRVLRERISQLRHKLIPLRRYLRPQKDALKALISAPLDWMTDRQRLRLRDTHDQLIRYLEDLDAARDRADVVQDWLQADLSDRTNRVMLILSVVTAIFLPLGLISGLLGMNVSGIPGAETPYAFLIVIVLMCLIGVLLLWVFRYFKII